MKVFIASSSFAEHDKEPLRMIEAAGLTCVFNPLGKRLQPLEIVTYGKDCQGIIAGLEQYTDAVLEALPQLRCISRCGVGVDNISLKKAKELKIEVRNTPDVVIQPVAELTVAMIFDLLKNLTVQATLMRTKRWERKIGGLLMGKKVGVLGLGRIGKRVAEILRSLKADVYGFDIAADERWAKEKGITHVSLEELLRCSDIVTIHLSNNGNGRFELGDKEIALMKDGAMVINTSRGDFINEEALADALKRGKLAGAALDVYKTEPYTGILCDLENVILTPHIATFTVESRRQMEIEASQNIINTLVLR
ncbi:MAG: phosphoglycerate dehydrogenase [Candidatus Omnitrophica bacterium]|nr:phosphoglycerate dehydrogenase [Candidatus Omnitrophota bacterium]